MRAIAGFLLGVVAWVWLRTLRLTVFTDPTLPADRPWVLVFFHGKQFPLLAWKRRRLTTVMVSHSKDGAIQARALTVLGFDVVRGSSSRGGARALAAVTKRLRAKGRNRADAPRDAAFAVDGPRGPYGVVKPGALLAAKATGAVIVPMGSAIAGGWVFRRAWDRFALPAPFGRAAVVVGPAVAMAEDPLFDPLSGPPSVVERGILQANARAEAILAASDAHMVASSSIE